MANDRHKLPWAGTNRHSFGTNRHSSAGVGRSVPCASAAGTSGRAAPPAALPTAIS